MVHGKGKGNSALVDLVGTEVKRERIRGPFMHQVGPDVRWKMLEEGTMQEKGSAGRRAIIFDIKAEGRMPPEHTS